MFRPILSAPSIGLRTVNLPTAKLPTFSSSRSIQTKWSVRVLALWALSMLLGNWANEVQAGNPWVSAIGEARVVQHRAEDIANRIKRTDPRNYLVRDAMEFDRVACAMVELLRGTTVCNRSSCNQVQQLYRQMESQWGQLRFALCSDPCLRGDRTLKGYADSMDTRMRNLCKAIDRVIERELRYAPVPQTVYRPQYPSIQPHFEQHFDHHSGHHGGQYGEHDGQNYGGSYGQNYGYSAGPSFGYRPQGSIELRFSTPGRIVNPYAIPGHPSFGVPSNAIPFGVPNPYQQHGFHPGPRRSF